MGRYNSRLSSATVISLGRASDRLGDPFDGEDLDDVPDLDVVEAIEGDAALGARLHFTDVILEPAERGQLAVPDDGIVAQEPGLRVAAAGDAAVGNDAAGNRARLGRLENLADLRLASRPRNSGG